MMETLNELAHLRDSGFGRPRPRHGLKLLYWFAKDCVYFGNGNIMLSECDPADGDFGFHLFENRYYKNRNKLLPDINFPYYVVGNLNVKKYPKAEELPDNVLKDYSPDQNNSNTDRIIVSLYVEDEEEQSLCFKRVYVTQHLDRSKYDRNATYPISRGLLMNIRRRSLEDFLEEMGYPYDYSPQTTSPVSQDSDDFEPETENSDTIPLIKMYKPTEEISKKVPKKKKSCNECCTIF